MVLANQLAIREKRAESAADRRPQTAERPRGHAGRSKEMASSSSSYTHTTPDTHQKTANRFKKTAGGWGWGPTRDETNV